MPRCRTSGAVKDYEDGRESGRVTTYAGARWNNNSITTLTLWQCLFTKVSQTTKKLKNQNVLNSTLGGSKNRNPRNPPKFAKSSVFNRPIVSATCLNQHRQPPTLSGWHTWTVDETKVASSLNFSIPVECSLLFACECVDFVSSAVWNFVEAVNFVAAYVGFR